MARIRAELKDEAAPVGADGPRAQTAPLESSQAARPAPAATPGTTANAFADGDTDATQALDAADRPENFDLSQPTRTPEQADAEAQARFNADQNDLFGGQTQAAQGADQQARDTQASSPPVAGAGGGLFAQQNVPTDRASDAESPSVPADNAVDAPPASQSDIQDEYQDAVGDEITREKRRLRDVRAKGRTDKAKVSEQRLRRLRQQVFEQPPAGWRPGQTIDEQTTPAATPQPAPTYGANNKVISNADYEKLKAQMKAKLGQLNSGFDPELYRIGMQMAVYHVEAGARTFQQFGARMIGEFGDGIRPYLKLFYNGARDYPDDAFDARGMDKVEIVRDADVNAIAPAAESATLESQAGEDTDNDGQRNSTDRHGLGRYRRHSRLWALWLAPRHTKSQRRDHKAQSQPNGYNRVHGLFSVSCLCVVAQFQAALDAFDTIVLRF